MNITSKMKMSGNLTTKVMRSYIDVKAYRMKNALRLNYIWNWFIFHLAGGFSKLTGIVIMRGQLGAIVIRKNGSIYDLGVIARGLVTTAFCELMVDQLITETSVWGDFKYHDSGVGVTAANIADTDIETTDEESRATGTQVESSSVIYESVGTISYSTSKAITEHGLCNDATAGTLMDRHTFSAINVVNGDSIQFTYDLTCTAGG